MLDVGDYILIGCVATLVLMIMYGVVAVIVTPAAPVLGRLVPRQETVTLVTPLRCKAVHNGGHTLLVRAIGCERCRALQDYCNPVEATADEVEALEQLRRKAKV